MNIAELRKLYPQLKNLSDQEIALYLIDNNLHGLTLDELQQKYPSKLPFEPPAAGKKPDVVEDVIKGVAAGAPDMIRSTLVGPQKALVGLGYLTGLAPDSMLRKITPLIQAQERFFSENTPADYEPQTIRGRAAKTITSMALPIPGLGPIAMQSKLGALAGLLSSIARESGTGTVGEVLGAMAPAMALAAKKGTTPTVGYERLREAWNALTDEQRAIMMKRLSVAKIHDIPIQLWQAAPEETALFRLGKAVGSTEFGKNIRKGAEEQWGFVSKDSSSGGQRALSKIGSDLIDPHKLLPITPDDLKRFHDEIMKVADARYVPSNSNSYGLIKEQAELYGKNALVEKSQADLIEELQKRASALPKASAERAEIERRIREIYRGENLPPPTVEFYPNAEVDNVGKVLTLRSETGAPRNKTMLNPDEGTAFAVRNATNKVLYDLYPGLAKAMDEYDTARSLFEVMEKTRNIGGSGIASGMQTEARSQLGYELGLGAARTPSFMLLNPVGRRTARLTAEPIDMALGQNDLRVLMNIAAQNPNKEAVRAGLLSMLAPVKGGIIGWPEGFEYYYGQ